MVRAYKTYVRPLLEHNSIVWSPNKIQDIEEIERVQRKFTKRLKGYNRYSYEERLKRLNLQSLELRRLHNDLVWTYKIVFGMVDVNVNDFFITNFASRTRGHAYKLFKKQSSGARYYFFSERIVNVWNHLPDDVVFSSLVKFKQCIANINFTEYLKRF